MKLESFYSEFSQTQESTSCQIVSLEEKKYSTFERIISSSEQQCVAALQAV